MTQAIYAFRIKLSSNLIYPSENYIDDFNKHRKIILSMTSYLVYYGIHESKNDSILAIVIVFILHFKNLKSP